MWRISGSNGAQGAQKNSRKPKGGKGAKKEKKAMLVHAESLVQKDNEAYLDHVDYVELLVQRE